VAIAVQGHGVAGAPDLLDQLAGPADLLAYDEERRYGVMLAQDLQHRGRALRVRPVVERERHGTGEVEAPRQPDRTRNARNVRRQRRRDPRGGGEGPEGECGPRRHPAPWSHGPCRDRHPVLPMAHWTELAGVAAAAAAATCFDGAVLLQARAARDVDDAHGLRLSLLTQLATRRRWLAGTALALLGWPLQLLALTLAPVTVVQPTLAVGLVVLLAGAARLLGERVGAREWGAAGAVVAGIAVLAVASPSRTEGRPTIGAALACAAVLGVIVVAPFFRARGRAGAWSLIAAAGTAFALAALTSKLLTTELAAGRPLASLAWAAGTALCAGAGFLVDMSAMQRFEATRVAPAMFVIETVVPVGLAPLLFGERWGTASGGAAIVAAGLLLTLAGGVVLGSSRAVAVVASAADGEVEHDLGGAGQPPVGQVRVPR
jgi:drug/metabolite transporter (DMT)-like permease